MRTTIKTMCNLQVDRLRTERKPTFKMGLALCGVTCLNSSAVFQINFSARLKILFHEIPHKLEAQDRFVPLFEQVSCPGRKTPVPSRKFAG